MRVSLPALLVTLLVAVPVIASAQVYKWTDANGTTHFTQTPPPNGVKYRTINTAAEADQPVSSKEPERANGGNAGNNSSAVAGAGVGASGDQANAGQSPQLKRFCAQLESNIALLQSNQSLQRMGPDGKTTAMDAKVRAQQLKQQQLRYDAYCKK